jgi:hypothetical protein
MAVVTLNIHHRGVRGNEVPEVVKHIVLGFLSRFVFLQFDASIQNSQGRGIAISPSSTSSDEKVSQDVN